MIDLDNRITGMNYIVREIKKQESRLLCLKNDQKNIYDYKPYQIFLVLIGEYLNCLHGIKDLIKNIDNHLGQNYSKDIFKEDWFKLSIDLRTLCHHIETPIISVERGTIVLHFERSEKIRDIRFISDLMRDKNGFIDVQIPCHDLGVDMERFLNQWAKLYLKYINLEETINQIKNVRKDGTHKIQKIALGKLMSIVECSSTMTKKKD